MAEIKYNTINTNIIWDKDTISVIADVAHSLLNITKLFVSQNIKITGINVERSEENTEEIIDN